jgi:hypothetical protein
VYFSRLGLQEFIAFFHTNLISRGVTTDGFGLVIEFIEHLKIVTKNAIANSHTQQLNIECTKPSQSAVSSPVVVC